ncbi:MAG: tRNA guanosine(34) transglycosylase Tgt [Deinococcales bacterium]
MFEFQISAQSGRARVATYNTPFETVTTPMFMPVGTLGSVKSLSNLELREIGSQVILGNTYHLILRPGLEVMRQFGGLRGFMGYSGAFLTDSGGFQVMSLGDLRTISERGVVFRNHLNGDQLEMTPESSIEAQEAIGANIIMAFDECPPHPATFEYGQKSLERTLRWLERCFAAKTRTDQALFPIVQGGVNLTLRQQSLEATVRFAAQGYAIGGLAVGESKEEMYPSVEFCTRHLPTARPRYLMGVGFPEDLVASIALGVDMFDCVYPTRTARFGYALSADGRMNLNNTKYRTDPAPLESECDCFACRHHSRAYIAHLLRAREMLALRLLSLHNLRFLHRITEQARQAIVDNRYSDWALEWGKRYFKQRVPDWFLRALEQGRG